MSCAGGGGGGGGGCREGENWSWSISIFLIVLSIILFQSMFVYPPLRFWDWRWMTTIYVLIHSHRHFLSWLFSLALCLREISSLLTYFFLISVLSVYHVKPTHFLPQGSCFDRYFGVLHLWMHINFLPGLDLLIKNSSPHEKAGGALNAIGREPAWNLGWANFNLDRGYVIQLSVIERCCHNYLTSWHPPFWK